MTDTDTIVVEGYGDLARRGDISGRDVDTVAELLAEHGAKTDWLIAWLPDWLLEEKAVDTAKASKQIVHGRIAHETEKAYCIKSGRNDVWLPKSVITVFERSDDAEIQIPQHNFSEFKGGETP